MSKDQSAANSGGLWRFEGPDHWLENLEAGHLKVMTLQGSNDPYEFAPLGLDDEKARRELNEWRDNLGRTKGVICFTKNWENPLMWSHYAQKHQGVCLRFSARYHGHITEVSYAKNDYLAPAITKEQKNVPGRYTIHTHFNSLLAFKTQEWSYEKETRKIVDLSACLIKADMYFYPLIRLGHEDKLTPQQKVWFMLEDVIFGMNYDQDCLLSDIKELRRIAADKDAPWVSQDLKISVAEKHLEKFRIERKLI